MKYILKLLISIACMFLTGCNVNTSTDAEFKCIQQDVSNKTGFSIVSSSRSSELEVTNCITNLLKEGLSEDSAIKIALLNNKSLQATYEKIGFAKANLAQAKLLKNPIFSLSYKFATKANQFDIINMNLFQNFLDALLIPSKKTLALIELQKTKAFVTNQILQVINATKNAFYNALVINMSLEIEKKIVLITEAACEFAEVLFNAGNMTALELTVKKADYAEAKIRLADLEVELINAKEGLNRVLGLYGSNINWEISGDVDTESPQFNFDNLENRIISKSLDLEQSRFQMIAIAKKYGIDIANTVFSNFIIGPDSEREDNGVWFVGPAFSIGIPIFDFGKAVSAAAQAELYHQWNNYTALAVNIRSDARMARIRFLNNKRKSNYYQKVIHPLKTKIFKKAFEQYNAMQIGTFELLQTKIDELTATIQELTIQKELIFSRNHLDFMLSGGKYVNIEDWVSR